MPIRFARCEYVANHVCSEVWRIRVLENLGSQLKVSYGAGMRITLYLTGMNVTNTVLSFTVAPAYALHSVPR